MKKRTIKDPNEIIIKGDIAEIVLYNNKSQETARAIIDAEDIEKVSKYKWCFNQGYVVTNTKGRKTLKIQNAIMGFSPKLPKVILDHRDRNSLNNRKANLRFCSNTENVCNRDKPKTNTTGFKGIRKRYRRWQARIMVNQKEIHLGLFKDKIQAALAYNEAAIKYHGEFACLNRVEAK